MNFSINCLAAIALTQLRIEQQLPKRTTAAMLGMSDKEYNDLETGLVMFDHQLISLLQSALQIDAITLLDRMSDLRNVISGQVSYKNQNKMPLMNKPNILKVAA